VAKNRFAGMSEQMKKAVGNSDLQVAKKNKNTVIEINIEEIINPPFHDRYSVNTTSIKELAEDISLHGLINPITVRKTQDGKFQRISGYRRVEAFKLLNKKSIPAISLETDNDIQVLEIMFSENKHRENPSEYDIIIFHLEALAYIMDETEQNLKNMISQARKIEQGILTTENKDLLKKVDQIKELLEKTKSFSSINSFYQKMTNILALNQILISAIQGRTLYYTIAIELNKATKSNKSKNEIEEFLKKSIIKNYSLSEAKKAVQVFIKVKNLDEIEERRGLLTRKIKKLLNEVKNCSVSEIERIENLVKSFEHL